MKTPLARSNSAAGQHKYKKGKRIILHIPKLSYLASLSQSVLKIGTSCFPNVIAKWCGEVSTRVAQMQHCSCLQKMFCQGFPSISMHLLLISFLSCPQFHPQVLLWINLNSHHWLHSRELNWVRETRWKHLEDTYFSPVPARSFPTHQDQGVYSIYLLNQ